jgi:hypothetical protein
MSKYLTGDLHSTGNIKYIEKKRIRIVQQCRKLGSIFKFKSDKNFDEIFLVNEKFHDKKAEQLEQKICKKFNKIIYKSDTYQDKIIFGYIPQNYQTDIFGHVQELNQVNNYRKNVPKVCFTTLLDRIKTKEYVDKPCMSSSFDNEVWSNYLFNYHIRTTKPPVN